MASEANVTPKLYELELSTLRVTVKGITPLICNRYSEDVQGDMEAAQQGGAKRGKKPRDPEAERKRELYMTDDSRYGFPAGAFKLAMVRAATDADMKMTDARRAFHVIGDILPIRGAGPFPRTDRVVLGGKTTSIAYRPEFRDWEMDIEIRYNVRAISAEQLINLLQLAGFGVGIGAWRPDKKGNFGMFEVKA